MFLIFLYSIIYALSDVGLLKEISMVSESYKNLKGVTDMKLANPAPMRRPFLDEGITNITYDKVSYIATDGRTSYFDPDFETF